MPRGRRLLAVFVAAVLVVLPVADGSALAGLRGVGYAVCHQLPDRSFFIEGAQLPLCARCTGIYLGFLIGMLGMAVLGKLTASQAPPRAVSAVLLVAIVSMGLDGFNSLLQFVGAPAVYETTNFLRLATGMAAGTAIALLIVPLLNESLWAKPDPAESVSDLGELAGYGVLVAMGVMVVYSTSPFLLYPIAVVSTFGVLATLTAAGAALTASLMKKGRRAVSIRGAYPLLAIGFALAVASLAVFGGAKAYFSLTAGL